jgi:tetratricopeptide (TPR) repeat protein
MNTSTKPTPERRKRPRNDKSTAAAGPPPANLLISDELIADLRERLTERRIRDGIRLFEEHAELLTHFDPAQKNAASLAAALAVWADIGFDRRVRVGEILERFTPAVRSHLPIRDYMHLQLAEGMVAMADELPDAAIPHFDFVLGVAEELGDRESLSIANFWKGRCLRKKGEYDQAMMFTVRGRELAQELGHPAMAAVMRVLESWLLFQKGRAKEATAILQEANAVLRHHDDYVTLGNIHSSYGRMARRDGRYEQAIEHFTHAIEEYKKADPYHRNLARSLANIALVKRYVALQLRRKIDAEAQRRRQAVAKGKPAAASENAGYRARMEQLRQEAFAHLDEAASIYPHHPNYHGAGTVHLNCGYLHLDDGDFDQAQAECEKAHALGEEKRDLILMARARVLQCMIENGRIDEEIGEGADPGKHARRALEVAREAVELARHTQNRRLLAQAYVWQGLSHCCTFFDDYESARQSYEHALALMKGDETGHVVEGIQTLKARLARSGSVDATLRAWSQGTLGDKTFQQITEDFADLIIPKVWEREGRKVSRVAAKLSISPKKVRRILSRTGRAKKNL